MRVLCVEDETGLREDIAEYLRLEKYEVDEADCGEAALERLHQRHYDAVLCDIKMPRMDGFGLLETVRKENALTPTPFIFLSAYSSSDDKIRAHQRGCDGYLTKPIDFAVLSEVLKAQISRQHARVDIFGKTTDAFANHVIQAVSDTLHRPMAEARSMIEHLRETKPLLTPVGLDQALTRLEGRLSDHMRDLFLLVAALQLHSETNGLALTRVSARDLLEMAWEGTLLKKHGFTPPQSTFQLTVDRALMGTCLSYLLQAVPKTRQNSDTVTVEIVETHGVVFICDRPEMSRATDYVTVDDSMNLAAMSEATRARIIPLMFALQVAHAHGGRLAVKIVGEDELGVRIYLPRVAEEAA